jgi:hypothetical protein
LAERSTVDEKMQECIFDVESMVQEKHMVGLASAAQGYGLDCGVTLGVFDSEDRALAAGPRGMYRSL